MATVQVVFNTDKDGEYTMVFGDSYKKWREQLQEYIWQLNHHKNAFKIESLYLSHSRFVQTGLKWCEFDEYRDMLVKEQGRDPLDFNWVRIELPKVIIL